MDHLLIDGFVLLNLEFLGHGRLVVHLGGLVPSVCRSSWSIIVLSDSKWVLFAGQSTSANLIIALRLSGVLFLRDLA